MSPIIENCRLIICKDCEDVGTKLWNSARPRLRLRHGRAAGEMRRNLSRIAAAAAHRPRQGDWRAEEANILLHAEATSHISIHRQIQIRSPLYLKTRICLSCWLIAQRLAIIFWWSMFSMWLDQYVFVFTQFYPILTSSKAKWTHSIKENCNKPESLNLKTIFQLSFLAGVGTWPRPATSWHSHLSTKQTRPQELLPKYSTFYISLTQYNAMTTLYVLLQSVKGSYLPKYFILWHLIQPSTQMFEISILKSLQKYFKSLCWKWTGIQLLSPSNQYHNKPRLWCRHSAWQFYHPNWIHPCSQL